MKVIENETKEIQCPQKKYYLSGSNAGTVIMVSVNEKGEGKCPVARLCKALCEFNK